MLQRPKIPADALSSAFAWEARVDSWLGQTWLGRVPVKAGSVTWTTSQQVQGTLSLTVPRIGGVGQDEGARDWTPLAPDSPLATMGQVLHVQVTVASLVSTDRWDIPLGRFLITQWEVGATDIRVTGKSLLQRLEDDRLTSPTVPYSGGTLGSELRRLVGGHMGVIVSDALTNRPCPSMSWGESRIDAAYEIADAWPARLREGPDGVLYVLPPVPAITERPETTLTDGEAGTVIGVTRQGSRAGIFNRIVARGQEQDDAGQPRFQAIGRAPSGHHPVSPAHTGVEGSSAHPSSPPNSRRSTPPPRCSQPRSGRRPLSPSPMHRTRLSLWTPRSSSSPPTSTAQPRSPSGESSLQPRSPSSTAGRHARTSRW